MEKNLKTKSTVKGSSVLTSPELKSAFVRLSHRIDSHKTNGQVVKLEGRYFRVKELG